VTKSGVPSSGSAGTTACANTVTVGQGSDALDPVPRAEMKRGDQDNDATLVELASRLHERTGVKLVVSAVHKVLAKMEISRKKKTSTRASATVRTSAS
jgi:transposase